MRETEIKILNINPAHITKKLLSLGAQKQPTALVIEKSFDFPNRKLGHKKSLLRLRKVGKTAELTYKTIAKKAGPLKTREETETRVENFEIMEQILRAIGLHLQWHREKKRTSFTLGKTKFEIDEYPRLPPYLEIEGSQEEIGKYVKLLGFTMKQASLLSATKLLKQHKVNHVHLVF